MVDCIARTVREGVLYLWRGNDSSVIRYYPFVALNFSLKLHVYLQLTQRLLTVLHGESWRLHETVVSDFSPEIQFNCTLRYSLSHLLRTRHSSSLPSNKRSTIFESFEFIFSCNGWLEALLMEGMTVTIGYGNKSGSEEKARSKAEIDASTPFKLVKHTGIDLVGWVFEKNIAHKPSKHAPKLSDEMVDIAKVDEEAAQLERDLVAKEQETLNGLKQLETTKSIVKELKSKLQKEAFEINERKLAQSLIPVMMEPMLGKERM